MRSRLAGVALLVALALAAAACGGGSGSSGSSGGGSGEGKQAAGGQGASAGAASVKVNMIDFKFQPASIQAKPGQKLTVTATNSGKAPHTFTIPGLVDTGSVSAGQSKSVTFTVPKKTVQFVCTFHKGMGMVGTLKVAGAGGGGGDSDGGGGGGGGY